MYHSYYNGIYFLIFRWKQLDVFDQDNKDSLPLLPESSTCFKDSSQLQAGKISNFKIVSEKKILNKDPPPFTPMPKDKKKAITTTPTTVLSRPSSSTVHSSNSSRKNFQDANNCQLTSNDDISSKSSVKDDGRSKSKYDKERKRDSKRIPRLEPREVVDSQHIADVEARNAAKREDIIKNKPDVYSELRYMEINRGGSYFYDCKACGIQEKFQCLLFNVKYTVMIS